MALTDWLSLLIILQFSILNTRTISAIDYNCGLRTNSKLGTTQIGLKTSFGRQSIDEGSWPWVGYIYDSKNYNEPMRPQIKCIVALTSCNTAVTSRNCEAFKNDTIIFGDLHSAVLKEVKMSKTDSTDQDEPQNFKMVNFDPPIYEDVEIYQEILPICIGISEHLSTDCKLVRAPILTSRSKDDDLLPLETDLSEIGAGICSIFSPQEINPLTTSCYSEVFNAKKHLTEQEKAVKPVNCDSNGLVFCKRSNLGNYDGTRISEMWFLAGIMDFQDVCKELVFTSLKVGTDQDLKLYLHT